MQAIEKYWKDYAKKVKPALTIIRGDLPIRNAFKAGYEAALESLKKCQSCGVKNEVHPAMYDCHKCRAKHY